MRDDARTTAKALRSSRNLSLKSAPADPMVGGAAPVLLSQAEAARLLGLSVRSLERLRLKGRLKAVRFTSTGHLRYRLSDLQVLVEQSIETVQEAEEPPVHGRTGSESSTGWIEKEREKLRKERE